LEVIIARFTYEVFQVSFPYKILVLKMQTLLLTKYMWKTITFHCLPSSRCDFPEAQRSWQSNGPFCSKNWYLHETKYQNFDKNLYQVCPLLSHFVAYFLILLKIGAGLPCKKTRLQQW
jgi:hypothetical protein